MIFSEMRNSNNDDMTVIDIQLKTSGLESDCGEEKCESEREMGKASHYSSSILAFR